MRDKETVFWLTLVDFLVQVIFFGIFAAIVYLAISAIAKSNEPVGGDAAPIPPEGVACANETYGKDAGYSGCAALTDDLSRLVPADRFKDLLETLKNYGGVDGIPPKLPSPTGNSAALGHGPCLEGDPDKYRSLAKIRVFDDRVEIVELTPQLDDALSELALPFALVQTMPLPEFEKTFSRLQAIYPHCRHYIDMEKHFKLAEPLEAVNRVFLPGRAGSSVGPYRKTVPVAVS